MGMPGPSCPVGIPHLVKGGAATQPSGSHETGGESAHGTLGMGPEKGETAAFTVQFSLIPHTFSCSHRNPPWHTESVILSERSQHLPWHLLHRAGPARTLLLVPEPRLGLQKIKLTLVQCLKLKHLGENLHRQQA